MIKAYHASEKSFDTFITDPFSEEKRIYGGGVNLLGAFFSEAKEVAKSYPFSSETRTQYVYECELNIVNPKVYNTLTTIIYAMEKMAKKEGIKTYGSEQRNSAKVFKDYLISQGYDGITFKEGKSYSNTRNKKPIWVAFSSDQITILSKTKGERVVPKTV